jgi:hypothetical protein
MGEYSKAELKLISVLSSHWFNIIKQTSIIPSSIYGMIAQELFIENRQGPEVDALRRVCRAISDCKPYRRTPEFDALCKFE